VKGLERKKNVQPFFSLNNNNNNNNKRVDAEKVWDFNMLQVATISSLNIPLRQQKKKIPQISPAQEQG
jgi:hypothetical protein